MKSVKHLQIQSSASIKVSQLLYQSVCGELALREMEMARPSTIKWVFVWEQNLALLKIKFVENGIK